MNPPADDRLPVVLVVLDGLGDRPVPELGGRTPSEAAATPVLDAFADHGASGWHLPFGWGRAPTSEWAHWAMFGFSEVAFPGRAVLEAAGAGIDVEPGVAATHAALRTSRVDGREVWVTGRAGAGDGADASALLAEAGLVLGGCGASLTPLGAGGEALLVLPSGSCGDLTDSDPFFEGFHPWLRVLPTSGAASETADLLNALLVKTRGVLLSSVVNAARVERGLPALDLLTTKWSGTMSPVPAFAELTGVAGGAVTSTRLYRGIARLLGMGRRDLAPVPDPGEDIAARLVAAEGLIEDGARFVHVHTKVTDEAGHTKKPRAKLEALESLDAGLVGLHALAARAIVAVTGDHATPSTAAVLHTGDPTPLVIAGPTVRPDGVSSFGEAPARAGWYGVVHAEELLPLLFGHANRPALMGHRTTRLRTLALPDHPQPMPGSG
ncbi:MAG: alkaline phosphatase family protein [Acidimicrobiales bacterium]